MTDVPATLQIPVENQVRELDAKLLLASVAAERGYPVVLGSRGFLHYAVDTFPRGVYLAKSMRRLSDRMFGILRNLGHEIVGFDEEGLVRLPDDEYYRRRLSAKAVGSVSHLLAWGPDDARALRAFPASEGIPIHVTGNPRIDMLRPELRAYLEPEQRRIRDRFGNFVLINTNFGEMNHFFPGLSEARNLAESEGLQGETEYMKGRAHFRLAIFRAFQEMLPALAEALPDVTIVLRPHPSESHDLWRELTRGFDHVHVINDGSVLPWLLAASGMVQNGCTTAVEAQLLETPTIGYHPIVDERFDDPLPFGLSHRVDDLPGLIATVRDAHDGKLTARDDAACRALIDQHLAATSGPLGADRMIDVLDDAGYRAAAPPPPKRSAFAIGWLHTKGRSAVKHINMRRPGHRNHRSFHDHRFPPVSTPELQERVDRLARLLGRFDGVRVEPLGPYLFRIRTR